MTGMNAFEYAMKMEQDGKAYYEEQAAKMPNPAMKQIFEELARDETKHYETFKAMRDGKKTDYEAAFRTNILDTTKNVFQTMRDEGKEIADFAEGVRQAWDKARDIEDKSEKFYREQAGSAADEGQKKIWSRIADEEHKHWVAINNVVKFIDRPNQWLEDAEWHNMEQY
jgi:rubrerythrin